MRVHCEIGETRLQQVASSQGRRGLPFVIKGVLIELPAEGLEIADGLGAM